MKKTHTKSAVKKVVKNKKHSISEVNRIKEFTPVIEDVLPKYKSRIPAQVLDNIIKAVDKLKKGQSFFVPKTVCSDHYIRIELKKHIEANKRFFKDIDLRVSKNSMDKIEGVRIGRFN